MREMGAILKGMEEDRYMQKDLLSIEDVARYLESLITFLCLTNAITRRRGPELLILANFL